MVPSVACVALIAYLVVRGCRNSGYSIVTLMSFTTSVYRAIQTLNFYFRYAWKKGWRTEIKYATRVLVDVMAVVWSECTGGRHLDHLQAIVTAPNADGHPVG